MFINDCSFKKSKLRHECYFDKEACLGYIPQEKRQRLGSGSGRLMDILNKGGQGA